MRFFGGHIKVFFLIGPKLFRSDYLHFQSSLTASNIRIYFRSIHKRTHKYVHDFLQNSAVLNSLNLQNIAVFKHRKLRNSALFLWEEHWVPGGEEDRLLIQHINDIGWNEPLFCDEAEHVFIEPVVGHDEVALVA